MRGAARRRRAYPKAACPRTRNTTMERTRWSKHARLCSRAIARDAFAAAFIVGLEAVLATARARPGDPRNTATGGGVVCGSTACYIPSVLRHQRGVRPLLCIAHGAKSRLCAHNPCFERRDDALDGVHAPRRRSSTAFLELLKRQRAVPRGNGANAEGWWRGPPSHGPVTARVRPACVTRVRMLSNLDTPGGSQGVCPHAATYGAGNGGSVVRQTAARAGAADRRHGAPDQAPGAPDLRPPTKIRDRPKFRGDPGRQNKYAPALSISPAREGRAHKSGGK